MIDKCFLPENNVNLESVNRFREKNFLDKYPIIEYEDINDTIGSNGDFQKLMGLNAILKNIITDLRIENNTYFFDPEMGSGLHTYIFEPADITTQDEIEQRLRRILDYYKRNKLINNFDYKIYFYKNNKGYKIDLNIEYSGKKKNIELIFDTSVVKHLD
jgi:phage baseplate assembly protein W